MNELRRVETYSSIETRSASVPISRKLASALLVMLTVSAMIAWFGYLGWELLN
jgi:hypothetical protein